MKRLILLSILLGPSVSFALDGTSTPSINAVSGTFSHGNSISITGSGFGTKSPAKPHIWAPFDELSVGATAAANSTYSTGTLSTPGTGDSIFRATVVDLPHGRSSKSVRAIPYHTVGVRSGATVTATHLGATQLYMFVRQKVPSNFYNLITNSKYMRFLPDNWSGHGDYIFGYSNFGVPFDSSKGRVQVTAQHASSQAGPWSGTPPAGRWYTEEWYINRSDLDVANGKFKHWVDGYLKTSKSDWMNNRTAYPATTFGHSTIGWFWSWSAGQKNLDNPPLGAYVYYDDIYIDTTWSRVMIGNASTFDACTHREPLIPTAWSASSITANFNQGSFPNGSKVYLFVVNSNGNASPGKVITIGGTLEKDNSNSIPVHPGNLRIL